MPLSRILWAEHPVVFVWKVQESAWYTPRLQRGESGYTLGRDEAVVFPTVNDKLGRGPLGDVIHGVPPKFQCEPESLCSLLVCCRPRDAIAKLVGREPDLFGRIIARGCVKDPIVAYDSFEAELVVVALNPVGHVAAIRCAEGSSPVSIDLHSAKSIDVIASRGRLGHTSGKAFRAA